jgi:hypothetical protein
MPVSELNKPNKYASHKQTNNVSQINKSCNCIWNGAYKVLRELVHLLVHSGDHLHIHELVLLFREPHVT